MIETATNMRRVAIALLAATTLLGGVAARAEVPGITGTAYTTGGRTFDLVANAGYNSQPDGNMVYSWGYGCSSAVTPGFLPTMSGAAPAPNCPTMQMPGPTLIVTEGENVTVNLTNHLPTAAGNTSILFPGMTLTSKSGGIQGPMTQEAPVGETVSYTFTASKPGTYAYYSGSQTDLQVEMGLFGAIVVLPNNPPGTCNKGEFSDAASAYDIPGTCYDREYLFQFSEMDSNIHEQVKAQVDACGTAASCPSMLVTMEPYRPNYYLINARSMPDIQDTNYAAAYPNQPYNGNPHMHPGDLVLMRIVGQGRWQHPFHYHGNHARVIARDANPLLSQTDSTKLAGPLLYTISTVSGQTVDAIFTWTGQDLNWDVYGLTNPHDCNGISLTAAIAAQADPRASFDTADPNYLVIQQLYGHAAAPNNTEFDHLTREFCPDHGKPIPATPPDPNIVVNGQWYAGTPYIGLQEANPTPEAPGTLNLNPEAGYAYMWHSHDEREITTNDVFPGGMLMMLLVDPSTWHIDETQ